MAEHAPTPWKLGKMYGDNGGLCDTITGADMDYVLDDHGIMADEDLAFIVKAVNCHDDLVSVLTELMAVLRKEAPGTALNNHRFDALGIRAYAALAAAGVP